MQTNTGTIRPETAAKLAAQLFPDSDAETSLDRVLEWLYKYNEEHRSARKIFVKHYTNDSSLSSTGEKITSWTQAAEATKREAEPEADFELLSATGVRNNPQIKEMMTVLLAHAKANKISASDLAGQIGASYPTILNWQRGKLPRGENIRKVHEYLKKLPSR